MSEKLHSHESTGEKHGIGHEIQDHHEKLRETMENRAEGAGEKAKHEQESARHEVHERAISGNEFHRPQSEKRAPAAPNTKKEKARSFNTTMHHVRNQLSTPEKTLSTFIHKPIIEKASEVAGNTIARPSGIAGATIAAFVGLLFVYGIARYAGFELSGSEMPILLVIGFIVGLLIEWAYKSARSLLGRT